MKNASVGLKQRLAVPPTVYARTFDEEIVLLDLGAGEYFSLDGVGSFAWAKFAAGQCVEEIATEVSTEFDVEFDRALGDLLRMANELVTSGLLVPSGGGEP